MNAVDFLRSSYDGSIPADLMAAAVAEDAANPPAPRPTAIEEARMMVAYYADLVRRAIKARRAYIADGCRNSAYNPNSVAEWFREWRRESRRLRALEAA